MAIAIRGTTLPIKGGGDPVTADDYRAIRNEIIRLGNISGTRGITVAMLPTGIEVRGESASTSVIRMKVKTAADANGVAVCNTWDGTTAGTTDLNVRVVCSTAVGEQLWAMAVTPNAAVQKDSKDVTLMEFVSGPTDIVALRQTGGTLGADGATASSWTYDLYDPTNTFKRASGVSPEFRPLPTWTDAAGRGQAAYYGGVWHLIQAFELLHDESKCDDIDWTADGY